MTVVELIRLLEEFPPDTKVVVRHSKYAFREAIEVEGGHYRSIGPDEGDFEPWEGFLPDAVLIY